MSSGRSAQFAAGSRSPSTTIGAALSPALILMVRDLPPDCLLGLADFSHVEVVFLFHLVHESEIAIGSRHPRGRLDWPKVGIFAQRGKDRPNRIGVTVCQLLSVEHLSLNVAGLDAIDCTPVLDIKPYMREFAARGEIHQPEWVNQLMADTGKLRNNCPATEVRLRRLSAQAAPR